MGTFKKKWISAIVLAAGESKRMGRPKQLMPFGNKTILEQVIDSLLDSRVDEVVLVLGYHAEELRQVIANRAVKIVVNPDYHKGMSTSIIAGLKQVSRRTQAVMFVLGDQPLVSHQTIDQLIQEFDNHGQGIAIPTYRGRRGHPVIFDMKYKDELLKLTGDIGARQIALNHPEEILEVPVNSPGIIIDIDTTDDYNSLSLS